MSLEDGARRVSYVRSDAIFSHALSPTTLHLVYHPLSTCAWDTRNTAYIHTVYVQEDEDLCRLCVQYYMYMYVNVPTPEPAPSDCATCCNPTAPALLIKCDTPSACEYTQCISCIVKRAGWRLWSPPRSAFASPSLAPSAAPST